MNNKLSRKKLSRKMVTGIAVLAAAVFLAADTESAEARHGRRYSGFGFHIGGPNVHVDIGNPHGYRSRYVTRSHYVAPRAHYDYHDTSHYDYHPASYTRHNNHFDYKPAHFDYHNTGHYDRHSGYRH